MSKEDEVRRTKFITSAVCNSTNIEGNGRNSSKLLLFKTFILFVKKCVHVETYHHQFESSRSSARVTKFIFIDKSVISKLNVHFEKKIISSAILSIQLHVELKKKKSKRRERKEIAKKTMENFESIEILRRSKAEIKVGESKNHLRLRKFKKSKESKLTASFLPASCVLFFTCAPPVAVKRDDFISSSTFGPIFNVTDSLARDISI